MSDEVTRSPLRIGVVAPSGVVELDKLDAGIACLEARGHTVREAPHVRESWRAFAGKDDDRLADFVEMASANDIDVVMAARGGYGWSRLLHRLDWPHIAATGKAFVGFSDFTAFSMAAMRHGLASFAGPMVAAEFSGPDGDDLAFVEAHFWPMLRGEPVTVGPVEDPAANTIRGAITGPLWGTNLTLLTHLAGTPFMPQVEGGILILEDVTVQPYALERMLWQLLHAGVLGRQRAIILGHFVACEPARHRYPYSIAEVVETLRTTLQIPVLTGFPFGHVRRKCTVPVGGTGVLSFADGTYTLLMTPPASMQIPPFR